MSKANVVIITDKAELDKRILAWSQRGKKWVEEGHQLAMSALTMASKHNDVGPVNRLYLAMPKGTKSSAMVSWLLSYGMLVANEGDNKKEMPFKYTKDKAWKLEEAAQDPWYNHKPEPAPDQVFDLQKALEQVINRAKGKQLVHADLLPKLQEMLAATAGNITEGSLPASADAGADEDQEGLPEAKF